MVRLRGVNEKRVRRLQPFIEVLAFLALDNRIFNFVLYGIATILLHGLPQTGWHSSDRVPVKSKLLCAVCITACLGIISGAQDKPKYLDPDVAVEQRVDDLLHRMTTEEKISQMWDSWGSQGIPRLSVPPLLKTEGLHGQSYSTGATIFPQGIAMAATFDPDLIRQVGKQTAVESKAAHLRASWSPVLDVVRDVRWGRTEETYGESPFLVSRMGVAWITGFQSQGMIAVPKHFAGHGQPMGGRDSQDVGLSDRTMREIHLPGFRAAVEEAHAGGVMAAYGTWDGVPDNASTTLLQKILRQEWGFDGMVVSDCGGPDQFLTKHAIAKTPEEAAALAAKAGVNMECGDIYKNAMIKAVSEGLVSETLLDEVARPTLRTKFRLGLFDQPTSSKMLWEKLPEYDTAESRALASKVEVEGAVLLRNDKHILPLSKQIHAIAVVGSIADDAKTGDYSPKIAPGQLISVLQGVRAHAGPNTQVLYAAGLSSPLSTDKSGFADAVAAAKKADVAVVVVGDNSHPSKAAATTGENRDGSTLDFPGAQRDLIQAIYATGTPVVLVIVNGKPFTLDWESEHIPGILVTWYPGEDGGSATAQLLFGEQNPSGRLPVTWPRSAAQLPLVHDYHPSGRGYDYYDMPFSPQYRFGYGLSYTQFKYSDLHIAPKPGDPGFVTVSANVQNVGDREGDEVAQLYLTDAVASVSTPVIELQGIKRVPLKPGETRRVEFELTPYQLSLLDADMVRRVEPGTFRVHVGGVSPDVPKNTNRDRKATIGFYNPLEGVSGEFQEPKPYSAHFTYTLEAPVKAENGHPFPATIHVRNDGNLTDVTEAKLYRDIELDSWRFELKPGEEKSHTFYPAMYRSGELVIVAGTQLIAKQVSVTQAPARAEYRNIRFGVDENAVLEASAEVRNVGSSPYQGPLVLKVDGKPVGEPQTLNLGSGEERKISLSYSFAEGGLHRVQINDAEEQEVVVPAGLSLALRNPLIGLKLDKGNAQAVRNEITGAALSIHGTPHWVDGNTGKAIQPSASAYIDAGSEQLYRKSFTLSASVKIDKFGEGGDVGIFGGRAPMGADQDNTGTVLSAGIHNQKLFLGFQGREIVGAREIPLGTWINLAYTYDAAQRKGALYLNGALDKTSNLDPYTGPLETIGTAPALHNASYAIDGVLVTQNCLSSPMVKLFAQHGLDSLLHGEYVSAWRPSASTLETLEATTSIPRGDKVAVIIETGDGQGKVTGSLGVNLEDGKRTYQLKPLKAGVQLRVRVQIEEAHAGLPPVLRTVVLDAKDTAVRWSTPKEWSAGTASNSIVINNVEP
jgi:beta-glucosidase